jgi:hypothetical protein
VVARDGIEPPTPAFSRAPYQWTEVAWNQRNRLKRKLLAQCRFRINWDYLGCFPPQVVPVLFPGSSPLVRAPEGEEVLPCHNFEYAMGSIFLLDERSRPLRCTVDLSFVLREAVDPLLRETPIATMIKKPIGQPCWVDILKG